MSAQANRELALRPMLPGDVATLAAIFRDSVMELTGDDYSEAQQEAWVKSAEDEAAFAALLERHVTIVATLNGAPVGFASLESDDKIGFLYVHPAAAGYGAGMMLADALEKLASSRKAGTLSVDASDTAYGFFAKRGYDPQQRNQVQRADEWLSNTTMRKDLPACDGVH
ncbi:putative N-acetyltransferase YafP [Methyloligella halotolerans]|uniref:Putative N-acetyltransferase YafP n=1 Tax=Methyloligella halotolerans TaxID=1177755 RepID=A0A1E2RWE5_9HYPH|nr:GNAT family N-acetyltransferase [Methyloligella halotolerans]ODA66547.1 putative N-acetyltransferase YafP [Methyloligella halotolerans]